VLMIAQIHRRLGVRILGPVQVRTTASLSGVLLASFALSYANVFLAVVGSTVGTSIAVLLTRQPDEGKWLRRLLHLQRTRGSPG
jgi:hypothetical protein